VRTTKIAANKKGRDPNPTAKQVSYKTALQQDYQRRSKDPSGRIPKIRTAQISRPLSPIREIHEDNRHTTQMSQLPHIPAPYRTHPAQQVPPSHHESPISTLSKVRITRRISAPLPTRMPRVRSTPSNNESRSWSPPMPHQVSVKQTERYQSNPHICSKNRKAGGNLQGRHPPQRNRERKESRGGTTQVQPRIPNNMASEEGPTSSRASPNHCRAQHPTAGKYHRAHICM